MLMTLLLVNTAALVGTLLMARYSVLRVDERGEVRPQDLAWTERLVEGPSLQRSVAASAVRTR